MDTMENLLLSEITEYLIEHGYEADLDSGIIHIEYNDAMVIMEEDNNISLSFSIAVNPTESAIITKLVMEAAQNYKQYKVEIYEPYLEIFDENDNYVEMLFGEEIGDYMNDLNDKVLNN